MTAVSFEANRFNAVTLVKHRRLIFIAHFFVIIYKTKVRKKNNIFVVDLIK